jgi:type III pantothenate kinase
MVDGLLERLLEEIGKDTQVVATGGLASRMSAGSKYIRKVDDFLTLEGLRIVWERNAGPKAGKEFKPSGSSKASR